MTPPSIRSYITPIHDLTIGTKTNVNYWTFVSAEHHIREKRSLFLNFCLIPNIKVEQTTFVTELLPLEHRVWTNNAYHWTFASGVLEYGHWFI